jgi:hypothetical protein
MPVCELIKAIRQGSHDKYELLVELFDRDDFISSLDTRWLVSVLDTIADHDKDSLRRSNAMMVVVFVNTIKFMWTAELMLDTNGKGELGRHCLWDGMKSLSFDSEKGNASRNMFRRMNERLENTPFIQEVFQDIVRRIKTNQSHPLTRIDMKHGRFFENSGATE